MLSNSLILLAQIMTLFLAGLAIGISIFTQTSWPVLVISLLLFGWAMTAVAFLVTALCRTSSSAVSAGMLIVIIGLLQQSMSFSSPKVGYIWWRDLVDPTMSKGKIKNYTR